MKKKLFFYLIFLLIFTCAMSESVCAETTPPAVEAESAILMDAKNGTIVYEKSSHVKRFPASITKLMTALLVYENCEMDEIVTFSHNAVYSIERGSSNIGIDERETLTVEDALYALLLASANEVANGLAEHVAGSVEAFAEMMNTRASELGCTDTHFINPNGLPNEDHYTSAYDMALIAKQFFSYDELCKIAGTPTYHISATPTQPDEIDLGNHNKMLPGTYYGSKYYYNDLIGGKTGYTNVARQTLVTCAMRDEVKLVCVVMKDETPYHYKDSIALFDYGFANYTPQYDPEPEPEVEILSEVPEEQELVENEVTLTDGSAITQLPEEQQEMKEQKLRGNGKELFVRIIKIVGIVLLILGVCFGVFGLFLYQRIKAEKERQRRRRILMEKRRLRLELEQREQGEDEI